MYTIWQPWTNIQKRETDYVGISVTRLGEISSFGRFFVAGRIFLKNNPELKDLGY
jgi:hypothetical protein